VNEYQRVEGLTGKEAVLTVVPYGSSLGLVEGVPGLCGLGDGAKPGGAFTREARV